MFIFAVLSTKHSSRAIPPLFNLIFIFYITIPVSVTAVGRRGPKCSVVHVHIYLLNTKYKDNKRINETETVP